MLPIAQAGDEIPEHLPKRSETSGSGQGGRAVADFGRHQPRHLAMEGRIVREALDQAALDMPTALATSDSAKADGPAARTSRARERTYSSLCSFGRGIALALNW